jgi:RHS repeat-associated protein
MYRAYVSGGSYKVIGQLSPDGQFHWRHESHLGSGYKLTSGSGTVVYRAEHDPHGQLLLETGSTTLTANKFTSYERDNSTGLDYANARMYSGSRGRFTKPDPAGLSAADARPQSLNQYTYTDNDPVNMIDPSGNDAYYYECRNYRYWYDGWRELEVCELRRSPRQAEPGESGSGGGGGRGGGSGASDLTDFLKNAAKDLAKKKLDKKDCQNLLATLGVTAAQVIAGAQAANIMNGVGSTVSLSSLYATSSNPDVQKNANTVTGTVGERLADPGTRAVAQLGGPAIYVDPAKFDVADYWQNLATVMHEVLHNVTGLTDSDIQRKLGLDENKPSHNITEKLKKDCF